ILIRGPLHPTTNLPRPRAVRRLEQSARHTRYRRRRDRRRILPLTLSLSVQRRRRGRGARDRRVFSAELPPRTLCTFRRELSSLRRTVSRWRTARNVLEELSGV